MCLICCGVFVWPLLYYILFHLRSPTCSPDLMSIIVFSLWLDHVGKILCCKRGAFVTGWCQCMLLAPLSATSCKPFCQGFQSIIVMCGLYCKDNLLRPFKTLPLEWLPSGYISVCVFVCVLCAVKVLFVPVFLLVVVVCLCAQWACTRVSVLCVDCSVCATYVHSARLTIGHPNR